jgi:hypothetical protein
VFIELESNMIDTAMVRGAYGRRYSTEEQVIGDWEKGLDFYDTDMGSYCSIRDYSGENGWLDTPIFRMDTGASIIWITLPRGK